MPEVVTAFILAGSGLSNNSCLKQIGLVIKSAMVIASLRAYKDKRYGVHGERLRRKLKDVEMIFKVESASYQVSQPTHVITPAGSMINKEQVIKEIAERISTTTSAGVTESQLNLEWAELKKGNHDRINNGMESVSDM